MSCYHPLKAWKIGVNPESGKDKLKVTSYDVEYVYKRLNSDLWIESYFPFEKHVPNYLEVTDFIEIPCGKCIGCRLKYSKTWATRCMLEAMYHKDNWFLTLTYNDEHLPEKRILIDENGLVLEKDGEILESPFNPLVKKDMQNFMKRLRKRIYPNKVRFYGCGEYGSKYGRPHYHLILFGLQLDDLKPIGKSDLGHPFYTSELIESCWRDETGNSIGFHKIGACTYETCAYVARYVTKKHKGLDRNIYEQLNYEPEFTLMSRKPGIGYQYYEEHKHDIYENEEIFIPLRTGSKRVRPPNYYDKLYDLEYPSDMAAIKDHRKELALTQNKLKQNLTTLSYMDMLKCEENNIEQRTKILKERSKTE